MMCLAIPAKILTIDDQHQTAVADFDGVQKKIIIALLPQITIGQFVIVHAGYAIEQVNEEAAHESILLWRDMLSTS